MTESKPMKIKKRIILLLGGTCMCGFFFEMSQLAAWLARTHDPRGENLVLAALFFGAVFASCFSLVWVLTVPFLKLK